MRPVVAAVGWLVLASPTVAQDVEVRAFVDRTRVAVGQQFQLSIEVSGDNTRIGPPELPDVSRFASLLGNSSSQQIQIVNGRTTVTRSLQYSYRAITEGTHEIGPATISVGGRAYRTDPITIEIVAAAANPPPAGGGAPSSGAVGSGGIPADALFVRARANRTWVYPNQPVIVEYTIYTRVNVRSYSVEELPTAPGFLVEEYPLPPSPETSQEIVDGRQYTTATIRKVALFPATAGTRTVTPLRLNTGVEVRRRARDPFDDFFSFGSLLGRVVEQPLASNPVTIEVRSLPEAGRPEDFTGVVGNLRVRARVDSTRVETDNALTLTLEVEGEGNLRAVAPPEVSFPADIETYPPDVTASTEWDGDRVTGRRVFEYVAIPRAPGEKTIPEITLSYFDPEAEAYRTVRTDPITLTVTGDPSSAGFVAAGNRAEVRARRDDIRFIQTEVPDFQPVDRGLGGVLFWAMLLAPLAAVGGATLVRRQRDRLAGDAAYARRRRASKRATRRLAAARALLDPANASEFHAEVDRALIGFLGDVLNIEEAGYIRDEAIGAMRERGVPEEVIDEYFACVDVCARMRFAPAGTSREAMQAFLDRAAQAMSRLEREAA